MKVKMILPALTEAKSPFWRPIKYSLFPPLGLATLAGYLDPDDEIVIQDEHVEQLDLSDEPDLVVIQVYITSAYRAYALADHYRARGAHVCLGGLHVTSLPEEAARHADTIFLGPGEDTWPAFLADFRAGRPGAVYRSTQRTLEGLPPIRRDLIKRRILPGAQLHRRLARLPARLRLLLQGGVLRRRHSRSTRRPSTMRCARSSGCRAATSTFWTTICSATRALPRAPVRRRCAAWAASGRRRQRCSPCCAAIW